MRYVILTTVFCCYLAHVNQMSTNVEALWPKDNVFDAGDTVPLEVWTDSEHEAAMRDGEGNWFVYDEEGKIVATHQQNGTIGHGEGWKSQEDFDRRVMEIRKLFGARYKRLHKL
jgi:hypothetical protein